MERGNFAMRPRERRETSERDLFRSRLDQIIDMKHALVKLVRATEWGFLEQTFGAVYADKPGQPPCPWRVLAGLACVGASGWGKTSSRRCCRKAWRWRPGRTR